MLATAPSPTTYGKPSAYRSSSSSSSYHSTPCANPSLRNTSRPTAPARPQPTPYPGQRPHSSPASLPQSPTLVLRSPKRPTSDAGTQYTPPDWPPTSSRTSTTKPPFEPIPRPRSVPSADPQPQPHPRSRHHPHPNPQPHVASGDAPKSPIVAENPPRQPPPEPHVRQTPQSSLTNTSAAKATSRRPRSPASDALNKASAAGQEGAAPSKKHRPQDGAPKILPADYSKCDPQDLTVLISALLMDLIRHNDQIPLEDDHLTRFHSRSPPGISVFDYLKRLTFHATLASPVLLAMVFYIDRLCAAFPKFTVNGLTVHRFLITAATVAAKGLCDVFWTNATYAKVGGVSLKELALLELELLTRVEWRIIPESEQLAEYYRSLIERNKDYEMEEAESTASEDSLELSSSPDPMDVEDDKSTATAAAGDAPQAA